MISNAKIFVGVDVSKATLDVYRPDTKEVFKIENSDEVNRQKYQTHEQATRAVIDYIERFYNPVRLHASVSFVSPNEFEKTFRASSKELAISIPYLCWRVPSE